MFFLKKFLTYCIAIAMTNTCAVAFMHKKDTKKYHIKSFMFPSARKTQQKSTLTIKTFKY